MPNSHILSFGPYQLDTEKVRLWCDTQPVRLTPKAFQVLCYVVERPGQLVTKEELFRVVWADTVVGDAALTMCIQEIRKALQDNAKSPQYLETVHRQGFRFIAEVVSSQQSVEKKSRRAMVEVPNRLKA
jgi:DNA-binding winged helix-turn-helix (wHTH) protein